MRKLLILAGLSVASTLSVAAVAQAAVAQDVAKSDAPATTAAAPAADASPPKTGFALKDKNGHSLGKVDTVRTDAGYLTYIDNMAIYHVPLATVSVKGRVATTSMARSQITH